MDDDFDSGDVIEATGDDSRTNRREQAEQPEISSSRKKLNEGYEAAKAKLSQYYEASLNKIKNASDKVFEKATEKDKKAQENSEKYAELREACSAIYGSEKAKLKAKYDKLNNELNRAYNALESRLEVASKNIEKGSEKVRSVVGNIEDKIELGFDKTTKKAADILGVDQEKLIDYGAKKAADARELLTAGIMSRTLNVVALASTISPVLITVGLASAAAATLIEITRARSSRNTRREHKHLVKYRNAKNYEEILLQQNPEIAKIILDLERNSELKSKYKIKTKSARIDNPERSPELNSDDNVSFSAIAKASIRKLQDIIKNSVSFISSPNLTSAIPLGKHLTSVGSLYEEEKSFEQLNEDMQNTIKAEQERNGAVQYKNIDELAKASRQQRIHTLALKETIKNFESQKQVSREEVKEFFNKKIGEIEQTEAKITKSGGIIRGARRELKTIYKGLNPFSKYTNEDKLAAKIEKLHDVEADFRDIAKAKKLSVDDIERKTGVLFDNPEKVIEKVYEESIKNKQGALLDKRIEELRNESVKNHNAVRKKIDTLYNKAKSGINSAKEASLSEFAKGMGYVQGTKPYQELSKACDIAYETASPVLEPAYQRLNNLIDKSHEAIDARLNFIKRNASKLDKNIGRALIGVQRATNRSCNAIFTKATETLGVDQQRVRDRANKMLSTAKQFFSSPIIFRVLGTAVSVAVGSPTLLAAGVITGATATIVDVFRIRKLRNMREKHNSLVDYRNDKIEEELIAEKNPGLLNLLEQNEKWKKIPLKDPTANIPDEGIKVEDDKPKRFSASALAKAFVRMSQLIAINAYSFVKSASIVNAITLSKAVSITEMEYQREKAFEAMKDTMAETIKNEENRYDGLSYKNMQQLENAKHHQKLNLVALQNTMEAVKDQGLDANNPQHADKIQGIFEAKMAEAEKELGKAKNQSVIFRLARFIKNTIKILNPFHEYYFPKKLKLKISRLKEVEKPELPIQNDQEQLSTSYAKDDMEISKNTQEPVSRESAKSQWANMKADVEKIKIPTAKKQLDKTSPEKASTQKTPTEKAPTEQKATEEKTAKTTEGNWQKGVVDKKKPRGGARNKRKSARLK